MSNGTKYGITFTQDDWGVITNALRDRAADRPVHDAVSHMYEGIADQIDRGIAGLKAGMEEAERGTHPKTDEPDFWRGA